MDLMHCEVNMNKIKIGNSDIFAPSVALGVMRLQELDDKGIKEYIHHGLDLGLNFFDHADIYGGGECERLFGKAISDEKISRDKYIIQTKCGIRPEIPEYDLSKKHILESVDKSLYRLQTDYIDILLLHRPDCLVEPEEVAEAFRILKQSGKVKYFGVSNHKPSQIDLLEKFLDEKLVANQLQLSVTESNMITNGMNVNMTTDSAIDRDGSVLDYCRLKGITVEAWSPLQYGFFKGTFINNPKFEKLNETLEKMGDKYFVRKTGMAIAYLLRHPAKIQVVIGTMNRERIDDIYKAMDINLSREDWYEITRSAGNMLP